ncbi:acid phosphatase 1-like [Nicotiana tabacum]|uniref:Acid phosphatase 1-like n=2 Tax=Nicotiana TaxID=4085 RepID=A0A1S3X1D8_TOBAC|nr:PREDICTED: acid phosphatase 1-like [Nicotiana sylvestris]XP_016433503.1 PREDICTED: acid phosphatase 1-like [Nicotiana tabacum]
MRSFALLFFISTIVAVTVASTFNNVEVISQVVEIHRLRPQTGSAGYRVPQLDCLSWRLAVETNNLQNWKLVPISCENYIGHYMLGKQYRHDCEAVANAAIEYAKSLKLSGDGKDVWVFDIDETTLSNLPYYARSDVAFGAIPFNSTKFNAWVAEGKAPAIPSILGVYKTVLSLGIKPVFITGTRESFKQVRITNLKKAGYSNWAKLVLKGDNDSGTAVEFKSSKRTELVKAGYRIVGNIGDQWSDILGDNVGSRTFKVPDPMYYIG